MKRKRGILISLLCCCIFLTGCWSYRELTDIGFVLAFGIDEGKEDKYLGTFQIVNPKNAAGGEQGGGMQGPPSTIYQGEGDNLLELNRATTQQTSRRTYFAHTSLVVVGEDVARKGVKDFLDLLTRSQEFRPTADIVIAKDGTAEDLLSTLTPIDQFSTIKIEKTLKNAQNFWGENIEVKISDVAQAIVSKGKQPIISGFKVSGDKEKAGTEENITSQKPLATIHADSIGVFKDDKLVAWATDKTARGFNWVLNNIKNTVVSIDWEDKKNAIGAIILRSKADVKPTVVNKQPKISIHLKTEGIIAEMNVNIDLTQLDILQKIEKGLAEEIESEIKEGIEFAKKYNSDVFGFGEKMSIAEPKYWQEVEDTWNDEVFQQIDVDVNVETFIRRTQLKLKSLIPEEGS